MIHYPNLIPECNVDTVFVESLGYHKPTHASDIHQVCAILEKKVAKEKAIGFIDNDKKKPRYLSEFQVVDKVDNVKLLKHKKKSQYLVVVTPAMDRFLFNLCKELEIDIGGYGLPTQYEAFQELTKKESIKRNAKFRNLLNTIHQKNPPKIARIRSWIAPVAKA